MNILKTLVHFSKKTVVQALLSVLLIIAMISGFIENRAWAANPIQEARDGVVQVVVIADFPDYGFDICWQGSGFVVDTAGEYIVTNAHVAEDVHHDLPTGTGDLLIAVHYGRKLYFAEEVDSQFDPSGGRDLAVLRVREGIPDARQLAFQNSASIDVTDIVYALGFPSYSTAGENEIRKESEDYIALLTELDETESISDVFPYEIENVRDTKDDMTVTRGTVSRKTSFNSVEMIQSDVSITYGNSGGPLVMEDGTVVGINTLMVNDGTGQSAGYAISSEYIMERLDKLGVPYRRSGEENQADSYPEQSRSHVKVIIPAIIIMTAAGALLLLYNKKKKQKRIPKQTPPPAVEPEPVSTSAPDPEPSAMRMKETKPGNGAGYFRELNDFDE